jgi:endonuclease YncB( thermonuclease family)
MRRVIPSIALALLALPSLARAQDVPSKVFINGVPSPVFFNDGDSFRVLAGANTGVKARLAGFNTLESFGPVHRWGEWTAKELFILAKMATLNARRGVWHCTTDFKTDTYGRALMYCSDLAIDQVRRGLAHAMSVDERPADEKVLEAQRQAIKERRGIWAHGVPAYVLTSLHSVSEGGGYDGKTYNRMVSSRDGHSAKWLHDDSYSECQEVCTKERTVAAEIIEGAVETLRGEAELADVVSQLPKSQLTQVVTDFAQLGWFRGVKDDAVVQRLTERLTAMQAAGQLGSGELGEGSCVVYVEFERRYGAGQATCLRK